MSLSAQEAAAEVGMTKQGIIKAIKTGKISAEKDVQGRWMVQPVELFRVYPPVHGADRQPETTGSRQDTAELTASLRQEIDHLRELLAAKDTALDDMRRAMLLLEAVTAPRRPWWDRWFGSQKQPTERP